VTEPHRSRAWIVGGFALVLLLVLLDQWSKGLYAWVEGGHAEMARDCHPGHSRHLLAGEWLSLMTSCNSGAAFGRFDAFPRILVGGRVLAVVVLSIWLLRIDTRQRGVLSAMVLVLAGALGNVIDNLWTGCGSGGAPHGVRDFVNVWFEPLLGWDYHFPSFNVADSCISVGAVLWILTGFFHAREDQPSEIAGSDLVGEEPPA